MNNNKIIINPHYCSEKEYQKLKDYLTDKTWDWQEISSGSIDYNIVKTHKSSESTVLSEEQLLENIKSILTYYDPSDSEDYLDEGKQSELNTLMNCLNRSLTGEETALIDKERKKYFGEES